MLSLAALNTEDWNNGFKSGSNLIYIIVCLISGFPSTTFQVSQRLGGPPLTCPLLGICGALRYAVSGRSEASLHTAFCRRQCGVSPRASWSASLSFRPMP